jgi:hypothetical protein
MKKILLAAAATFLMGSAAHASIIPVLDTITPFGSEFLFSYHATLSGDQGLTTGSKVVIFDFAGYVPGSITAPSPFIVTSVEPTSNFNTATGGVQANAVYTDNPGLMNLVFTYNGPDFRTTGGGPGVFPDILIPGLTARSIYGGYTVDGFSSRAIKNSGLGTEGTAAFNNGAVTVPTAIPEPASWAMMIMGMGGLGAALRQRRRPQTAFA